MYKAILNANNQVINVVKSKHNLVNQVMLESVINRIDTKEYDYNIISRDNIYKIIITLKIGRA